MAASEISINTADRLSAAERRQRVLPWIIEASRPYCDTMFETDEALVEAFECWSQRKTSELWIERASIGFESDGEVIGGFIACPGGILPKLRQVDALAYIKSAPAADIARRREFLERTAKLFAHVGPGDLYLSRIGVLRSHRGRGHGRVLMEGVIRTASELGLPRIVLDVSTSRKNVILLYESLGFQRQEERRAEYPGLTYISMSRQVG